MSLKVIAGATGVPAALLLAEAGEQVRLVSRPGSGPDHPNIELVRADATDTALLAEVARGAATLYNCAMPPYDQWPALWPRSRPRSWRPQSRQARTTSWSATPTATARSTAP